MTDEDRKKLVADLLLMSDVKHYGPLYRRAADELKRLAEDNKHLRSKLREYWLGKQRDMGVAE